MRRARAGGVYACHKRTKVTELPRKAFDTVERPVADASESLLERDAFMDVVLIRDNAMCTGSIPYKGGEARLRDIQRPYLNVFCREDTIVPAPAAKPREGLVGSRDASELCASGHIGLVAGRYAAEVGRPAIADWIRRHSANRKTATAQGRKRARHPARAAAG